jgi:hypothetical protein
MCTPVLLYFDECTQALDFEKDYFIRNFDREPKIQTSLARNQCDCQSRSRCISTAVNPVAYSAVEMSSSVEYIGLDILVTAHEAKLQKIPKVVSAGGNGVINYHSVLSLVSISLSVPKSKHVRKPI